MDSYCIELEDVLVGCNSTSQCAHFFDSFGDNFVYSAGDGIAIYNVVDRNIIQKIALGSNAGRVTAIAQLVICPDKTCIITGDSVGFVTIFKQNKERDKWTICHSTRAHNALITCICLYPILQNREYFVCTTSSDGTLKLWTFCLLCSEDSDANCKTFHFEECYSQPCDVVLNCVTLCRIPGHFDTDHYIISAGGLDNNLHVFMIYIHLDKSIAIVKVADAGGHVDWINSIDSILRGDTLIVATGSKDKSVRIWNVKRSSDNYDPNFNDISFNTFVGGGENAFCLTLTYISSLRGHDDWINCISFDKSTRSSICLASSSADQSVMLWYLTDEDMCQESGTCLKGLGSIQTCSGFCALTFSMDGNYLFACGSNGSLHLWSLSRVNGENFAVPHSLPQGHASDVYDIAWSLDGTYLISVGKDKSCRIFSKKYNSGKSYYIEISRAQCHGWPILCVANISATSFVSGAEEKVLRVFEAPRTFLHNLEQYKLIGGQSNFADNVLSHNGGPNGARRLALGLSNVPTFEEDGADSKLEPKNHENALEEFLDACPAGVSDAPSESHLADNTLWPEKCKLYSHSNIISAIAASHDGTRIASSSFARHAEDAEIRIWDTSTWSEAQPPLYSHRMTVMQIEFSKYKNFFVSVGRDRNWCVYYGMMENGRIIYRLVAKRESHKRTINCCSWMTDENIFATGGHDKFVHMWKVNHMENWNLDQMDDEATSHVNRELSLPIFDSPITALAFAPGAHVPGLHALIAIGLENGRIGIWSLRFKQADNEILNPCKNMYSRLHEIRAHTRQVRRLKWRPDTSTIKTVLASCSSDYSIQVYSLTSSTLTAPTAMSANKNI